MNTPTLRFKEFSGAWEVKKLGDVNIYISDGNYGEQYPKAEEMKQSGVPFIRANNFNGLALSWKDMKFIDNSLHETLTSGHLEAHDILVTTRGDIGMVVYVDKEFHGANINAQICLLRIIDNNKLNTRYLLQLLSSSYCQKQFKELQTGSALKQLPKKSLTQINILHSSIEEQTKIANFLTAIDEKIAQLSQTAQLLTDYKKGVMQQIFSQQLRFKDDDGREFTEWEIKQLKEVAERITRKNTENNSNVLTISAQQGLINQEKFFNKSVAAKDTTGYYLLHNGDFAYNKSYSNGYPMGAIKCLNNYEKGVVSTLYICFKFKDGFLNNFFEHYFESGLQNREIEQVAQEGARNHGLLNIGLDDFFSIDLNVPSLPEQTKIANFLTAIDDKINNNQTQLDAMKQYKSGLLQQMFV